MYRIELRPGEEALFKSFEEFAKAVQNGVVSDHARIWHNASNKWLPIDFHPHFKRASAQRPASAPKPAVPETEAKVARAQKTRELLFIENEPRSPYAPPLKPAASAPAPAPAPAPAVPEKVDPFSNDIELPPMETQVRPAKPEAAVAPKAPAAAAAPVLFSHAPAPTPRHIEAVVAAAAPLSVREPLADAEDEILIDISKRRSLPSFKLPRIRLRHIYAAAGLALVAAAGLMLSGREKPATADTSAPQQVQPQPVASTSLAATSPASYDDPYVSPATPDPRAVELTPSGYMQVSNETMPAPVTTDSSRATLPSAPRMSRVQAITSAPLAQQSDAMTPSALAARYRAAYDDAGRALESQLRSAGLVNIFAESRLASDNLGTLRVAIAGATNFLRGYRARDEQLDASYRDTAMQQFSKWSESETAAWAKAATLSETDASSTRADQLLSDISAMLGVLEAGAGSYKIRDGVITFESTSAAMEYEALRGKVVASLSSANTPMLATMKRVIGSTMPPATR